MCIFSSCKKETIPGADTPENVRAIDLGLSVKWANMNLGAINEDDSGDFYAWGETGIKSKLSGRHP